MWMHMKRNIIVCINSAMGGAYDNSMDSVEQHAMRGLRVRGMETWRLSMALRRPSRRLWNGLLDDWRKRSGCEGRLNDFYAYITFHTEIIFYTASSLRLLIRARRVQLDVTTMPRH